MEARKGALQLVAGSQGGRPLKEGEEGARTVDSTIIFFSLYLYVSPFTTLYVYMARHGLEGGTPNERAIRLSSGNGSTRTEARHVALHTCPEDQLQVISGAHYDF